MISWSFPPIVDHNSRILILGTMPGIKSIEMNEYYAHKQNAFWKILFYIYKTEYSSEYEDKIQLLITNKIALWDTLLFCEREGSADAMINNEIPNNFNSFFNVFPKIRFVFFNGKEASRFYMKYSNSINDLNFLTLPSTSPANARLSFDQKVKYWSIISEKISQSNE